MLDFKILGSGAGTGVPSFFCDCPGCQESRLKPEYNRTRSGALITTRKGNVLIDASPDIRIQLIRDRISQIEYIFLTHWHYDHMGGLGEFEFYVRLERINKLPLYLPPGAVDNFAGVFPHLMDVFDIIPWQFNKCYDFGDVFLTPLEARHSIETAGILVESKKKRLAYFPDTAGLPEETAKKVQGVDCLICDATFHGENWFPNSHMTAEQAIALGKQINAKQTLLTHMSIHYSQAVTTEQLEKEISEYPGVMISHDGMNIEL
ncbi:MAG TPA: MBL fold metallo-hydrolase [Syntrophomonadaceae bacterium]|nr:MBL fold metallo-hydrolase [Syntrophomonadaceae bacterium]